MIPRKEFLMETVPYFLQNKEKVGLIQTPQSFYNQDLFQFNLYSERDIPNEQDFFSREINILRNSSNSAAYTGSNTVISRKALEEIGGFPYGTITEDFETSIRLQKAGYITYATSKVLASGLSTTTVKSMIRQRIRWARGVIQSIRNTNAVFTRKLSLAGNLSYLNAYFYWWSFFNRMIFILAPILFALFDFQLARCGFWELMIFWLPSHLCSSMSMRYLSTNIRNMRWSQIIDTILAPYLIFPVLLESIGIQQKTFKVTEKRKTSNKTTSFWYILPHGALIVLSIAAIIRYVKGKYGMALLFSSVILFWLLYNLIALTYAVFFMLGRDSKRKFERIMAKENVKIYVHGNWQEGETFDVSENGIAFLLDKYIPMEKGEEFLIVVQGNDYHADLKAEFVYVKQTPEAFYYAATVTPKEETSFQNWMQIIHDREHSLPKEMDPWMTVCMTVCLSLIPYVVWNLYVRCRFSGIEQKFQLAFGKQESLAVSKEQYGQITEEFVKAAFSTSNRVILAFFLCNIAAVLAVLFVRIFLKKQWKLGRVLIVVDLMAILYHIGILGLYLFSMPEEEAVRLAGFDRYACSIMVLVEGLLFMQATIDMEHSFAVRIEGNGTYRAFSSPAAKRRYQYMVLATMMIGVNFLYSEINGLLYIQSNYSQSLAGRMETLAGDRWQEEEDQRKYFVAASDREGQVSNGEVYYVSRYFLNAPNVEVTERLDAGNMDEIKKEYDVLIILDESAVHSGTADVKNAVWNRSGVYPLKDN